MTVPITTTASPTLLEAEASFVGALMFLSAPTAQDALSLTQAEDFADPRLSMIAKTCRALADRGIAPDPAAVLAHVRAGALVTSAEAVRSLAVLLTDLYGTVPTPASVRWYRLAFLEGALRRRAQVLAERIAQAAEHDTIESLLALIVAEVQALLAVQQRLSLAGGVSA